MQGLIVFLIAVIMVLLGCVTNPVTGEPETRLILKEQELEIGEKHLHPLLQRLGGEYILDPELSSYVRQVGARVAAVSDRKLPYEFIIVNNSTPNALTLPGGKIIINRGLMTELNNEAELAAIFAHEIVHAAARHNVKQAERLINHKGSYRTVEVKRVSSGYGDLGPGRLSVVEPALLKYSRENEFEADRYSIVYLTRAGYDPQAAVTIQETFLRLLKEHSGLRASGWAATHPPTRERIEANRAAVRELQAEGELSAGRYQQKIVRLKKTQKAYDAYKEARRGLARGRLDKALAEANKALAIEPSEARFYVLRGAVRQKQQHYREALIDYDKAISLNNRLFDAYLERGLIKMRLGDEAGARSDLETSLGLLPTAAAAKALGDLALAKGGREKALEYYRTAAKSVSTVGLAAKRLQIQLDLAHNPQRYLKAHASATADGYAEIKVTNTTPFVVRKVRVRISYNSFGGNTEELTHAMPTLIAPNQHAEARIKLRMIGGNIPSHLEAQVIEAALGGDN